MCSGLFFKQKTAYEMRISDWSSDVCSSDLRHGLAGDLVDPWRGGCDGSQEEQREAERRRQEGCLQVDADDDAEPDKIDAERFGNKNGRASCRERVCQYV